MQFGLVVADHLTHHHGPLQEWIEGIFCMLFSLEEGSVVSEFLAHFTYDLLRVFLVFFLVLFLVSFLKTYISSQRVRATLLRVNRAGAIFLAAAAGLVSSTCVCTNVPLFLGLIAFGVPLHLGMTFLISSSLINVASLLSMAALTDWRFTLVYTVASFAVSILSGILLSFLNGNRYIIEFAPLSDQKGTERKAFSQRLQEAWHETKHAFYHQWLWILFGVALSALITSMVDLDFAEKIMSMGFWGVLLAAGIGVILHTDVISVVPVVSSLIQLDISFGILFSLTASLAFFSIPMLLMVKNTVHFRYLLYAWGIIFGWIILVSAVLLPLSL